MKKYDNFGKTQSRFAQNFAQSNVSVFIGPMLYSAYREDLTEVFPKGSWEV